MCQSYFFNRYILGLYLAMFYIIVVQSSFSHLQAVVQTIKRFRSRVITFRVMSHQRRPFGSPGCPTAIMTSLLTTNQQMLNITSGEIRSKTQIGLMKSQQSSLRRRKIIRYSFCRRCNFYQVRLFQLLITFCYWKFKKLYSSLTLVLKIFMLFD